MSAATLTIAILHILQITNLDLITCVTTWQDGAVTARAELLEMRYEGPAEA